MNKKVASLVGKIFLIVILFVMGLGIIFAGMTSGAILEVMKQTPKIDAESIKYEMSQNSTIVDEDGNEVDSIATSEYRQIVDYNQIPDNLKKAFVAVEDERFYKHGGVDPLSIIGSVLQNIKAGGIVRGGSTITQQLARNTYLSNDQTYERKIKEIYLALEIEENLSKEEILGAYLNRVFMGQNTYGVQAAAKTYFSKDVSELNLAQAAALAGVVQSPSENSLYKSIKSSEVTDQRVLGEFTIDGVKYSAVYNEAPFQREVYVLDKMLELGYISKEEYDQALAFDVASSVKPLERNQTELASYFNSLLEKQVVEKLMESQNLSENQAWDRLYYGGLRITTSIDKNLQTKLESIYDNFSEYLIGNSQNLGYAPLLNLAYDNWGNIIKNSDGSLLYYARNNILDENNDVYLRSDEAWYDENSNFYINSYKTYLDQTRLIIRDFYTLDDQNSNLRTHRSGLIDFGSNDNIWQDENGNIVLSANYLNENPDMIQWLDDGSFRISKDFYDIDLEGVIQPQSSSVVIDHRSGEIKAIMGGRDQEGINILDRASAVPRQPGSSIKPLATYTPALDNGFNLATGVDDVPFKLDENNRAWPVNVYGYYKGMVPIRDAIKMSINTIAISTLDRVGLDTSMEYLEKFGIIKEDPDKDNFVRASENAQTNDENLAALGVGAMSHGLTALDMTAAYSALANDGKYIEPLTFSKITDSQGKVLFDQEDKKSQVVTSPETAYQITSALQSAGAYYDNIYLDGTDFATKTGTTDNNIDFWCVGYTPYYTVGIWMGADNQNLSLNSNSVERAAYMWGAINKEILADYEVANFVEPDGIRHMKVDTISGMLPTDASYADPRGTVKDEIFGENNYPTKEDDIHQWAYIDSRNDLLASSEFTPKFLTETRSLMVLKNEYDPNKFNGIYPNDWKYRMPKTYSTLVYEPPEEEDEDEDGKDDEDKDKDDDKEDKNEDEKREERNQGESLNNRNN
ncbi:MAG: transglycosylase domain-containing protein [Anaerococcus sp.]|nr:transglycosylase domain-containing protein [Anaerococcus sp.]